MLLKRKISHSNWQESVIHLVCIRENTQFTLKKIPSLIYSLDLLWSFGFILSWNCYWCMLLYTLFDPRKFIPASDNSLRTVAFLQCQLNVNFVFFIEIMIAIKNVLLFLCKTCKHLKFLLFLSHDHSKACN